MQAADAGVDVIEGKLSKVAGSSRAYSTLDSQAYQMEEVVTRLQKQVRNLERAVQELQTRDHLGFRLLPESGYQSFSDGSQFIWPIGLDPRLWR